MSNKNDHDIYIIPPNFIETGTFFGGMFRARNVIEAGILAFAIGTPVFLFLPFGLTARIIALCLTALPVALVALIGISGESLSQFLVTFLKYLRNRRVVGGDGEQPCEKVGKHLKQKPPKERTPKASKHRRSGEADFPAEFDEVRGYEIREKLRPKKNTRKERPVKANKAKKKAKKRPEKERMPKRPAHIKEDKPPCVNPVADYLNLLITVTAPSVEDLEWKASEIKKLLLSQDMDVCTCHFREEQAFCSALPLVSMEKGLFERGKRNLLTGGAASCYPFTSFEMCDDNGILLGVNKYNSSLIIVDIFNSAIYKNANMAILGTSGAGKTFTMQLMALRMRRKNIPVFIIAPLKGHEFHRACANVGGEFIQISPASPHCINVMEIRKVDRSVSELLDGPGIQLSELAAKIQQLHIFFSLLIPDMSHEERQLLDEALIRTYNSKGITHDNASLEDPANPGCYREMPVLGDLYEILKAAPETTRMAHILNRLVNGSASTFNKQTNVRLDTGEYDSDRNFIYSAKGTYGTSGWMSRKEMAGVLDLVPDLRKHKGVVLGMLDNKAVCIPENPHINGNLAVYGSSGSMKTRSFCVNRILQAAVRGESLIISDPKSELYADKNCEGGKLPVPVHVLGEELTACGTIPDLSRRLSVIRSRNISMSCVFQNLAGLQNRYPLNLWQEILGNCDAQLFLGCTDELTAEFISSRTGLASVSVSSKSKQLGTWRISNYTPEYRETSGVGKRPVLTPDEVLRLPIKQALVIIRGQKVLKVDKMDYSKHPEASKLRSCKASAHIPEWRRLEQEQSKPSAAQPKPQAPAPKKPVKKKPKAASTSTGTKQTAAVPTAEAPNGIITTDKDSILS